MRHSHDRRSWTNGQKLFHSQSDHHIFFLLLSGFRVGSPSIRMFFSVKYRKYGGLMRWARRPGPLLAGGASSLSLCSRLTPRWLKRPWCRPLAPITLHHRAGCAGCPALSHPIGWDQSYATIKWPRRNFILLLTAPFPYRGICRTLLSWRLEGRAEVIRLFIYEVSLLPFYWRSVMYKLFNQLFPFK